MKITKKQVAKQTEVKQVMFGFYSFYFAIYNDEGVIFRFWRNANTDFAFVQSPSFEGGLEEHLSGGITCKKEFVNAVHDYVNKHV